MLMLLLVLLASQFKLSGEGFNAIVRPISKRADQFTSVRVTAIHSRFDGRKQLVSYTYFPDGKHSVQCFSDELVDESKLDEIQMVRRVIQNSCYTANMAIQEDGHFTLNEVAKFGENRIPVQMNLVGEANFLMADQTFESLVDMGSISRTKEDNETVAFIWKPSESVAGNHEWELLFEKSPPRCIRKTGRSLIDNVSSLDLKFEYRDDEVVPVTISRTFLRETGPLSESWEIVRLETPTDFKIEECYLRHYNLPEPPFCDIASSNLNAYLIVAVGIVCCIVAFWFRKSKNKPEPV